MSWRDDARDALRLYPRLKRKQNSTEQQITPVYGGTVVQHEATRVTENVALRSPMTDYELDIISAVELELEKQMRYYNAKARLTMIQTVYFRSKRLTLEKAAEQCGYSVDALKKWNLEVLSGVSASLRTKQRTAKKVYLDFDE